MSCEAALQSNTGYEFRVRIECTNPMASSEFSDPSAVVSTLPLPAEAPAGVRAVLNAGAEVTVQWTATQGRECNFRAWEVFSKSGVDETSEGECSTHREVTNCILNVDCGLELTFAVVERCHNGLADSLMSAWSPPVTTEEDEACIIRAEQPQNLQVVSTGLNWASLSWMVGDLNDCELKHWEVSVATCTTSIECAEEYRENTIAPGAYRVKGLQEDTSYAFRLAARCENDIADSHRMVEPPPQSNAV